MMISVVATLLMAAMGTTTNTTDMNASAFNFGLKSNDVNSGSIDTNSLFSCMGAAINCINTNQNNSNEIANNTAAVENGNGNGNSILTCEECLSEALTPEEIELLLALLEVSNLADVCLTIDELDVPVLRVALERIGLSDLEIAALLECLGIDLP